MILCTQISAQPCTKTLISRDLNAPLPISRQAWSLAIPMTRSYPDKHAPISGFLKHAVIQSTESSKILNFRGLFHESHFGLIALIFYRIFTPYFFTIFCRILPKSILSGWQIVETICFGGSLIFVQGREKSGFFRPAQRCPSYLYPFGKNSKKKIVETEWFLPINC